MRDVEVIQVVRTRNAHRGTGTSKDDPIRRIEQYWTLNGTLIAEFDPQDGTGTPSDQEPQS